MEAHEILSFYTTGSPFLSLFVLIGIVKANEVAKKQKERKERRKNLANKRNHYPPYTIHMISILTKSIFSFLYPHSPSLYARCHCTMYINEIQLRSLITDKQTSDWLIVAPVFQKFQKTSLSLCLSRNLSISLALCSPWDLVRGTWAGWGCPGPACWGGRSRPGMPPSPSGCAPGRTWARASRRPESGVNPCARLNFRVYL